jgi:hypothetical protein
MTGAPPEPTVPPEAVAIPPLPAALEPIPLDPLDGPPLVPLVAAVEPPTPASPCEALLQPQSATNGGRTQRRRVSGGFVMGIALLPVAWGGVPPRRVLLASELQPIGSRSSQNRAIGGEFQEPGPVAAKNSNDAALPVD